MFDITIQSYPFIIKDEYSAIKSSDLHDEEFYDNMYFFKSNFTQVIFLYNFELTKPMESVKQFFASYIFK